MYKPKKIFWILTVLISLIYNWGGEKGETLGMKNWKRNWKDKIGTDLLESKG